MVAGLKRLSLASTGGASLTVQHLLEQISPRKREAPPPSPRRILPSLSRLGEQQRLPIGVSVPSAGSVMQPRLAHDLDTPADSPGPTAG